MMSEWVYSCRFVGGTFNRSLRCGGCVIRCDALWLADSEFGMNVLALGG